MKKRLLYSLSGVGLVLSLVIGTSGRSRARENDTHLSPLRGTYSWSQFVPGTTAFGTPTPIPTAAVGTFVMDKDNNFTGHAVLNTPLSSPLGPAFEFDFDGTCTFRKGNVSNGMDCLVNAPSLGLSNIGPILCPHDEDRGVF